MPREPPDPDQRSDIILWLVVLVLLVLLALAYLLNLLPRREPDPGGARGVSCYDRAGTPTCARNRKARGGGG
jgi:hypothetical protein